MKENRRLSVRLILMIILAICVGVVFVSLVAVFILDLPDSGETNNVSSGELVIAGFGFVDEDDPSSEMDGYSCYPTYLILEYEEEGEPWVDFLRQGKEESGVIIPWVVSVKRDKVATDRKVLLDIERFCIPIEEVPDYGRGPNLVTKVIDPD